LTLLLFAVVSCKNKTKNLPVQKTITYDYRYETGGYFLQSKLHYYNDINTVFIKLSKSKGQGC
ncbi:MAG: hypothetical protein ACHQII_07275, partial [Bacteroidia bacterium]